MERTERLLIEQAQTGDQEAFRQIVVTHSREVFKLAFRMLDHEQDAEEVVQETFLRAFRRLHGFDGRSLLRTWLFRIAVNCALDLLKTRDKHHWGQRVDTAGGANQSAFPALVSEDPGPERLAMGDQLQVQIRTAMTALGQKERAAFILRHFQQYSIEEISQLLGIRQNAVKNAIFRAVRKMRDCLEPPGGLARESSNR